MKFRVSVLLLSVLLPFLSAMLTPVFADESSTTVETAELMIDSDYPYDTVRAGVEEALIEIPVLSTGKTAYIENIHATVTNAGGLPFRITSTASLAKLVSGNGALHFNVSVPQLVKPGRYELTITAVYDSVYTTFIPEFDPDSPGNLINATNKEVRTSKTSTLTYYVEVKNDLYSYYMTGGALSVQETIAPEAVMSGDRITVGVRLKNDISMDMKNVCVKLTNGSFVFDNDSDTKIIDIGKSQMGEATFNLVAPAFENDGTTQLTVTISYADLEGNNISKDYFIALNTFKSTDSANAKKAALTIDSITLPESMKAGEKFDAVVSVTNVSEADAENVEISITNDASLTNQTTNLFSSQTIPAGETKTYTVTYMISPNFESKFVNITASVSFKSSQDTEAADTKNITNGLFISGISSADVTVKSITIPDIVQAKGNFTMKVVLVNESPDTSAENISVVATPSAGVTCMSANILAVEKLEPLAETTVEFSLYADETAANGFSLIKIDVGDVTYHSGTVINNPKALENETDDIPIVIIESYDFGGEAVYGGQDFTLTLNLLNTSSTTAIKEMKVTVSSTPTGADSELAFTPVSSSNTFFIEYLKPKETVSKSIDLNVKSDVAPKSYGISVTLTYNEKGSQSETITIPVRQETRFNIVIPSEIGTLNITDEGYLSVNCNNMGKSTIYNVNLSVEGEGFSLAESSYYAGNLTSGQSISKEFYITPAAAGDQTGKIHCTYEDASGNAFEKDLDFTFSVIDRSGDMWNPTDPGMDVPVGSFDEFGNPIMEEDSQPISIWIWVGLGGGVLVLIIVIITVAVRVKRKKASEDEDY